MVSQKKMDKKVIDNGNKLIAYTGNWQHGLKTDSITNSRSDDKNASASITFKGKQIGFYSLVLPNNGYASVMLYNKKGEIILKNIIDLYAKVPASTLVYLSPVLPKGEYKLTLSTMGERPNWTDKSKTAYGSTGNFISLDKVIINE